MAPLPPSDAEPFTLSPSKLTTFLQCPRKYRFRYVERREPERRSVALALGTAVHGAIEWWWRERMAGRAPTEDAALRIFRADWYAELASGIVDLDGDDPATLVATGEALVRLFLAKYGDVLPEAVEERVEADLHDPETGEVVVRLVGYLDFRLDGMLGEIKTVSRRTDPLDQWGLQLAAYVHALRGEREGPFPVRVVMLVKTKEPKLDVRDVEVKPEHEHWFLEVACEAVRAIQSGAFHPIPSWACASCEYRRACRGT